ncbi:MAG: T9SS type A sorting domain-containing protein [Bacteroidales bacterium]|nr:T9SS type A sorting domain-containing protein [Bacteroidales bacterium]
MTHTLVRKVTLTVMALCALIVPCGRLEAQPVRSDGLDYYRDAHYHDIYSLGSGRLHFKTLLYAEGLSSSYYACYEEEQPYSPAPMPTNSMVWLTASGVNTCFLDYYLDDMSVGSIADVGYVHLKVSEGTVTVTNAYDGSNPTFTADGQWHTVALLRDTNSRLFGFEFDYYLPSRVENQNMSASIMYRVKRPNGGGAAGYSLINLSLGKNGGDQAPQLMSPVFHATGSNGALGYGKLLIPYVAYQQTYQYYTSMNPTEIPCLDQSGSLYVNSCDTVQHGYYLMMQTKSSESTTDNVQKQWLKSSKVDIPAYHKIYEFQVNPYTWYDSAGNHKFNDWTKWELSWKIKYPYENDAVQNEVFEVQRSFDSNFSDAVTVATIPFTFGGRKYAADTVLRYIDSSEDVLWNTERHTSFAYYRIRRASSALWGWENNPYAATYGRNSQLTLYRVLPNVSSCRRDPGFDTNHQVYVKLLLKPESYISNIGWNNRAIWDDNAAIYLQRILVEAGDTVIVRIPNDSIRVAIDRVMNATTESEYLARPEVHFYDHLTTPCVHYQYRVFMDTTNTKYHKSPLTPVEPVGLDMIGEVPYFTDAANLDYLTASHLETPEYVLLEWETSEGIVDSYIVETRPSNDTTAPWTLLGHTQSTIWLDRGADPSVSAEWDYRVTTIYPCQGDTISDSRIATGARSPWGRISGRIHYEDGTACPGTTVVATRAIDNTVVQRVVTDERGHYLLDSLPYGGGVEYSITPTSEWASFRYNGTNFPSATMSLTTSRAVASAVDFDNISAVRVTGRVLYSNSSIPVRDANLKLDGTIIYAGGAPFKTDAAGNFDIMVPSGRSFSLQVVKEGHHFSDSGYLYREGQCAINITSPLDGVRLWDETKVRLTGRVAGGLDQAELPMGFGLSTNNLGDNLKLVFELDGDNVSYVVRIPTDLTKDTLEYSVPHLVYHEEDGVNGENGSNVRVDTVGWTRVHYQLRRIIIEPDSATGEFCADLFPVRYKVTQATATGYSSLFPAGSASQTVDLLPSASQHDTLRTDSLYTLSNAQYKVTYRSPISITCNQLHLGAEVGYYGEKSMKRTNILNETIDVPLATQNADGSYSYLFGAPVFATGEYDFRVIAHEDYYYNNNPAGDHDQVRIKGGLLKVYNGMHDSLVTQIITRQLNNQGEAEFTIPVDYVSFVHSAGNAQRVLDLSVENNDDYVESQAIRAYVTGNRATGNDAVTSTHGKVQVLDILRDPPGSGSSAYIESGAEYSYNYVLNCDFSLGLNIGITIGTQYTAIIGAFLGLGGGVFTGQTVNMTSSYSFNLPIVSSYHYKHEGSYKFRTAERISTGSDVYHVGQGGDVYIGLVQNFYTGRTQAVKPIDSVTYASLAARCAAGTMVTLGEGVGPDSMRYYLVIGTELEAGTYVDGTFTYSHDYIEDALLPRLRMDRDNLLLTCDSMTAQGIANAQHQSVYWSRVAPGDTNWACKGYYVQMFPAGVDRDYADEVDAYNRRMADWVNILLQNEQEKVAAIHSPNSEVVGTYSLGGSTSVTHSDSYEYSDAYHVYGLYPGSSVSMDDVMIGIANTLGRAVSGLLGGIANEHNNGDRGSKNPWTLAVRAPGVNTAFALTPILDINLSHDPTRQQSHSRTVGYTLSTDALSNMDVTIYRMRQTNDQFNTQADTTRQFIARGPDYNGSDYLYGSFIYYLRGGSSRCPCELRDSTHYYMPKTSISDGTLRLENPRVDINVHEVSNVPVDRPAMFTLRMYNEIETSVGSVNTPITFLLRMKDQSNPHGARVYIDGMPLTDGRNIILTGNQVITKTMEVYAGDGYDFEDLVIELVSTCISTEKGQAQFSVHFMPVSCPVTLTAPRNNWVLNTLSPEDSSGYYIPVTISDFDVNYRGFDHIELQYKISTQGDDNWVNVCSYYADSTRYMEASGTKAMIMGGRIDNVRFYGERDPIEQRYDLRAVSFCRHGNGFISRSSEILSGVKDTRCPRVFGQPGPANGILGVGDNLLLRFNEPIAGNYLDEDNNFQLLGVTNSSGIASSTSVYFDGTPSCGASSEVTRILSGKSFSIDLMVKPFSTSLVNPMQLFGHTTASGGIAFGIEPAEEGLCRLYAYINDYSVRSLPLLPMTDFRRLVMTFDNETKEIRFYSGTEDITSPTATVDTLMPNYNGNAPLVFGHGFKGNMLEARLWIKVLSPEEIVATHEKRLTGFERKLAAYYPMNEGRGTIVHDKANGSTMALHGASWTTPNGFSLNMNGSQTVTLDQNIFARSANQDYTLMFWFRTAEYNVPLFSAMLNDSTGTSIGIENGLLTFRNNRMVLRTNGNYANGLWHHYVLTVNRIYNSAAIYVDGQLVNTFSTDTLTGLSGVMQLGGRGHIDDLALFEQALPKTLVEAYDNLSPQGDEMGLVAWMPFSEQRENENGIMEEVFSINNQRIFKTRDGAIVNKVQPLVISPDSATLATLADGDDHAPSRERDLLTKMNFDWAFNDDELLININMPDSVINKNSIYITVRNVEDLNGNRTVSPIMWQVYVNKNTLVWNSDGIVEVFYEHADEDWEIPVQFMNTSGRRHQYSIEDLPDWLHVNQDYGSIDPEERLMAYFTVDASLPVGIYSEIIYLTDEEGLSEPLKIYIQIKAYCPWNYINEQEFDHQMSLRGQVMVDGIYDSDPQDVVAAMIGDKLVGLNNVSFDPIRNTSHIYLTIFGTDMLEGKPVRFLLWQASTGRIYSLTPSENIVFEHNGMAGLPPRSPILLSTSANEVQSIPIGLGWNWISFNIKPDNQGAVNGLLFSYYPFDPGDQIKSSADMQFAEYDGQQWTGTLTNVTHKQMYMIYTQGYHPYAQVSGRRLSTDGDRTITLKHGWNSMPYLQTAEQPLTNALADYVDHASVGDLIKSKNAFAVFSENQRWEGSLTSMRPGEGYLFHRLGQDSVRFTFRYVHMKGSASPAPKTDVRGVGMATNMTVIAAVEHPTPGMRVLSYVSGTLTGTTTPQVVDGDTLFFITLGADKPGEVTFVLEDEGVILGQTEPMFPCRANTHHGSLKQPVMLTFGAMSEPSVKAYPTLFDDHVDFHIVSAGSLQSAVDITLRDAVGREIVHQTFTPEDIVNSQLSILNLESLAAGVYFATVNFNNSTTTIKLVKK